MAHEHIDSDTHFTINPITRAITNVSQKKTTLIQGDHNSEVFTFVVPRFIEGHDMSSTDLIQVHFNNIDVKTKEQSQGVSPIGSRLIRDDEIEFRWLIPQAATKYVGSLNFLIRFACIRNGNYSYIWNTAINKSFSIHRLF